MGIFSSYGCSMAWININTLQSILKKYFPHSEWYNLYESVEKYQPAQYNVWFSWGLSVYILCIVGKKKCPKVSRLLDCTRDVQGSGSECLQNKQYIYILNVKYTWKDKYFPPFLYTEQAI